MYYLYSVEVILDTNFIIACVKQKIDFISQLEEEGFSPILPREVFQELKDLKFKSSLSDREAISVALALFSQAKIKKMTLGNRKVDEGLIDKGKKGVYVATLDSSLRRVIPHVIGIDSAKNKVLVR